MNASGKVTSTEMHPKGTVDSRPMLPKSLSPTMLSVVIVAGGLGTRVEGAEKALLNFRGKSVLQHVLERLNMPLSSVKLNVNRHLADYEAYGCEMFSDASKDFLGPLEGMRSAWQMLAGDWILFLPCDNPLLPDNLIEGLLSAYQHQPAPLVVAHDGERLQPLYCLMHRSLQPAVEAAVHKNHLSVQRWIGEQVHTQADFSDWASAFANFNRRSDFIENG